MALSQTMVGKLQELHDRQEEVAYLLTDPDIMNNRDKFTSLSKEYAELEPIVSNYKHYVSINHELSEAQVLLEDDDLELRQLASDDLEDLQLKIRTVELELKRLLIPKDPNDRANIFLEIRAGTGGDEAAIFSGDLFRMYSRYAEHNKWTVEILSERQGEHGGYREIICRVEGTAVFSLLKFESGAHRVQRVPETESQGRVHTSACTVAILPEVEDIESIEIDKAELRVDTFRASGAGGQHVNKTDSAIRITHLPSGIVVECQDERSQHKNRARAMSLLHAKLLDAAQLQQQSEQAATRKTLVGSGDRSERIRTYNFPQGRVTDHRINLTLYKLDEIMQGMLDPIIQPLNQEHQADLLSNLSDTDES
tara:strand:+ start:153 stop:1253 length:1101 start_codon:yes stop_codon:yes gene_type:complete